MVSIQLDGSARLQATARDSNYTTKDSDLPKGVIEVADYPRAGDWIEWADGHGHTVQRVAWFVGVDVPLVVLD
jgi:hypothetical protein